jgi:hypothetical protein
MTSRPTDFTRRRNQDRLLICCHGKSNLGIELRQINATGKSLPIFRNESQAPKSKIFSFSFYPNQMHIQAVSSHQRGDRASSRARGGMRWTQGRKARKAIAGRDEPRERSAGVQDDRRFLRTVKPCRSGTRCWCQAGGGEIRLDRV